MTGVSATPGWELAQFDAQTWLPFTHGATLDLRELHPIGAKGRRVGRTFRRERLSPAIAETKVSAFAHKTAKR